MTSVDNEPLPTSVTLEVDGAMFCCQRSALATESPYFEAMFSNNFAERNKTVIKIQVKHLNIFSTGVAKIL